MSWFRRKNLKVADIQPGRESEPVDSLGSSFSKLAGFYDFATPDFDLAYLYCLEPLGIYNPNVSQALKIYADLGNTGHEVNVTAKNPEPFIERINYLARTVYATGGGMDGLVNHFLRQVPLNGALSGEWVVADRILDGLTDVVIPPVKTIRHRMENNAWRPYQDTGRMDRALVKLNPLTYSYMPMITKDGRPYGIPPFLAALKNLEMQLDAMGNIGHILRKMGLLGFLDVSLEIPERKPGESDEKYQARLTARLKAYAASYSSNFNKGVAVHYKDQEAKHNSVPSGAAAGAKQIWQLNEEQIFSALDIPPSLAGRSYSTTETYAEVDFDRLLTKLRNTRRMIKRFLEKGYRLDALLRGHDVDVSVTFNENSGFQEKEKAEADGQKIKNVVAKLDAGLISDDEAARELGYDEATGRGAGDVPPEGMLTARFVFNADAGRYEHRRDTLSVKATLATSKDRREENYAAAVAAVLEAPEQSAITSALQAAKDYKPGDRSPTRIRAQQFAVAVFAAFKTALIAGLKKSAINKICATHVNDAWQTYRYEDTSYLQASARDFYQLQPQRVQFGLNLKVVDANALRYLTAIDNTLFGAGEYLTRDTAAGGRFLNWLEQEYISKGLNIKDASTWDEFNREFPALVMRTSQRKIVQLVSTTIARVQNMGQTLSLYESGFKRYRIVGPKTAPVCEFCLAMVGRVFDVEVAASRLATIVDKGFEDVEDLPPFLSSTLSLDEVKEMSDDELQAQGFESPPYHPECRHRKAAED